MNVILLQARSVEVDVILFQARSVEVDVILHQARYVVMDVILLFARAVKVKTSTRSVEIYTLLINARFKRRVFRQA